MVWDLLNACVVLECVYIWMYAYLYIYISMYVLLCTVALLEYAVVVIVGFWKKQRTEGKSKATQKK